MEKVNLNKINEVVRATSPRQRTIPTTLQTTTTPTTINNTKLETPSVSQFVVSPTATATTTSTTSAPTSGVQSGNYVPKYIEPPQGQTESEQKLLDGYANAYNYGEDLKGKFANLTSAGIQANIGASIEAQAATENQIIQEEIANSISGGTAYTQEDINIATQRATEEYTKNMEKALSTTVDMTGELSKNILDITKSQMSLSMDTALTIQKERQWQEEMALKQKEFELAQDEFEFKKQQWEDQYELMLKEFELSEEEFEFMQEQWEEEFAFMQEQWEDELEFMEESLK